MSKLFGSPTSDGGDPASFTDGKTASGILWIGPQSRDGCGVNIENYTTRMNTNLSPISNCLTSRATVDVRGETVLVLPKQTCTICKALYSYNCLKKSASVAMPSGSGHARSLRSFDFEVFSVTGFQSFLKRKYKNFANKQAPCLIKNEARSSTKFEYFNKHYFTKMQLEYRFKHIVRADGTKNTVIYRKLRRPSAHFWVIFS